MGSIAFHGCISLSQMAEIIATKQPPIPIRTGQNCFFARNRNIPARSRHHAEIIRITSKTVPSSRDIWYRRKMVPIAMATNRMAFSEIDASLQFISCFHFRPDSARFSYWSDFLFFEQKGKPVIAEGSAENHSKPSQSEKSRACSLDKKENVGERNCRSPNTSELHLIVSRRKVTCGFFHCFDFLGHQISELSTHWVPSDASPGSTVGRTTSSRAFSVQPPGEAGGSPAHGRQAL